MTNFKMWKKIKKKQKKNNKTSNNYILTISHPHTMKKTHAKFQAIGTKLYEEFRSQQIPTFYILRVKND